MFEIEKVEFNKWINICKDQELNNYEISLINLIIDDFDAIAKKGTAGGKRASYIVSKIKELPISDAVQKLRNIECTNISNSSKIKKLDNLTVQSFRGFKDIQKFNLSKKYILFYGPNGSGKSSLCQALEYSLLGHIQEANTRKIELKKYIKNDLTKKSCAPELSCFYTDSAEPRTAISNYEDYRFAFIEKNRIDSFSHMNASPLTEKNEQLSALFGLSDFSTFISNFTDNIEKYFDLSLPIKEQYEKESTRIKQKKESIDKTKENLKKLKDEVLVEIQKLDKKNLNNIDKAISYLDGVNHDGQIYKLENEITKLRKDVIDINFESLKKNQNLIMDNISKFKDFQSQLTLLLVDKNFYDLYKSISSLNDKMLDYCPACKTKLNNTVVNPFVNAEKELLNFKHYEELTTNIENCIKEIKLNVKKFNTELENNNSEFQKINKSVEELIYEDLFSLSDTEIILKFTNIESKANLINRYFEENNRLDETIISNNKKTEEKIQQVNIVLSNLKNIYKTLLEKKGVSATYTKEIEDFKKDENDFKKKSETIKEEILLEQQKVQQYKNYIKAYSHIKKMLESYIQQLPIELSKDLSTKITEYYNIMNSNDAEFDKVLNFSLPVKASDKITLTLADGITGDALQVLSEGHVKILGLSILLAKAQEHQQNFLIFDDVVNAIDDEHRLGIIRLLVNHDDFKDMQFILTCHGDNFIAQFENEVPTDKRKKELSSYVFLFTTNIDERGIYVDNSEPMNALIMAKENLAKGRIKDAAQKARQAMECVAFKLWNKIAAQKIDSQLNVTLRNPKAIPDIYSVVNGLKNKLNKITFSDEENLFSLLTDILQPNNWKILNKGTHYEEDQKEFSRNEVATVIEIIEKIDQKIPEFKIQIQQKQEESV